MCLQNAQEKWTIGLKKGRLLVTCSLHSLLRHILRFGYRKSILTVNNTMSVFISSFYLHIVINLALEEKRFTLCQALLQLQLLIFCLIIPSRVERQSKCYFYWCTYLHILLLKGPNLNGTGCIISRRLAAVTESNLRDQWDSIGPV